MSDPTKDEEVAERDREAREGRSGAAAGPLNIEPATGVWPLYPSGTNVVEVAAAGGETADVRAARQMDGGEAHDPVTGELLSGDKRSAKRGDDDDDDGDFDPGDNNVDDVLSYVDKNPDQKAKVLKAEKAGKNRTTLVSQLEAR